VMTYLSLDQIIELHAEGIRLHGGSLGVRDLGMVDSAAAQPQAAFGGQELYPTLVEKAAALGYSLVSNHGFIDGNKRVGLAAMDTFLRVNGMKIAATDDDLEAVILGVAAGNIVREQLAEWLGQHVVPLI
jgi:death-on-curing protein